MSQKFTLKLSFLIVFLISCFSINAQEETTVNGVVVDAINGEILPGTTIIIKGKVLGTTTDSNGEFNFVITLPPPFTLVFSSVGYNIKEVEVTEVYQDLEVRLRSEVILEADYVISASRFGESVLQSPADISKLDAKGIILSPEYNFYNSISNLPGIQMNRNSLTYNSPNVRGFAGISNPRFVQIIDGMDNSPPGLNFALGNLVGVPELDVAEMELTSGPASAIYGPNAFNGVLYMSTKSPFDYRGISAYAKNGLTVQDAAGTNPFIEAGFRYAKVWDDILALKINATIFEGTDWYATDYSDNDLHPFNNGIKGSSETNPSYDGVNLYGDEIATTLDLDAITGAPTGTFGDIHVARTGYREVDLTDYNAKQIKADAALHYRLTDAVELIGSYKFGSGQTLFQGANRYNFRDLFMQQIKLEARSQDFFLRGYTNLENSGNSYDMRFAGWNMNRFWKSDTDWFTEYAGAYLGVVPGVDSANHTAARAFADRNRLEPGSDAFVAALDSITGLADLTQGARFLDRSAMYHLEGQYDFSNYLDDIELQIGGNFRSFQLVSDGTLFNDSENEPITNFEFGAYARGALYFLDDNLKLAWAARFDKNQNFKGQITPRAALIYSAGKNKEHNIRFAFQTGFRNPTTQNQYINLDIGVANLLGGVEDNVNNYSKTFAINDSTNITLNGKQVYDNSYTAASVQAFALSGNPEDLEQSDIQFVAPERVTTYEIGYRGIINKRLYLDINAYRNTYQDFIANINVVTPLTGSVTDLTGVAALASGQSSIYQLATNAAGKVNSLGAGLAFEYAVTQSIRFSGNYNFANFDIVDANPDLVPGFNMPKHRFGVGLTNNNIFGGFGFSVRYNYSGSYEWRSPFGNGTIDAYNTLNAQVTYQVPNSKVALKFGGNNMLGTEYRTSFGTPNIGSIFYFTIVFDELNDF
ncbi:MAG: TonB-dependent receptor [Saprospiraceae bacterium]